MPMMQFFLELANSTTCDAASRSVVHLWTAMLAAKLVYNKYIIPSTG